MAWCVAGGSDDAREGVSQYSEVGVSGAQDPAGFNREVLPEIGALQRFDGVEAVASVVVCCIAERVCRI
jgi:hypothetical protein